MAQRFSLSSSQLPEHERVPAWAKLVGENIFGGHLETVGAVPFEAALAISSAGPAICVEAQSTPVLLHRRKADIGPAQAQRFIVQAIVEGHPVYFEDGAGRYAARPGDLIMGVSDNACGFVAGENTRVVNLALPRALVVPRYADVNAIYRRFEERDFASGPATHLLFDLVTALGRGEGAAWRASSVIDAIGSLVALALDGVAREKLGGEGIAAARMSAIAAYLRAHY
ncbi:MAG TPA: hypothetical protein VH000_05665, partial [Rhizomicrobium sp.]|nr:hypothetical protein [Rhizomicrobium sp.]